MKNIYGGIASLVLLSSFSKQEYDEILNNYSKRKTANEATAKKIQQLESSIPTLESELEKYTK